MHEPLRAATPQVFMDMLTDVAAAYPMLSGLAVLTAIWYALVTLREKSGEKALGSTSTAEDGLRLARQRQQELLAQAAAARQQGAPMPAVSVPPPAPTSPASPAELPERMKAALARKAAAEGAATATATAAGTSASAPPPKPAAKAKTANDKNSVTQRLARIQKGKGPSDHNPLTGPAEGSSQAKFCTKKKGG